MKPNINPILHVVLVKENTGYTCNYDYKVLKESVTIGTPMDGFYIDMTAGNGRTGAGVVTLTGIAMQTLHEKICFRTSGLTFNSNSGAGSGTALYFYMSPDGTISTTA